MPNPDDLERFYNPRKEDSALTPESLDEINNQAKEKLEKLSKKLMEVRLPGDVYVTLTHGLDEYSIEFIQQIENRVDSALVEVGFVRTETSKSADSIRFVYRQFAKALDDDQPDRDDYHHSQHMEPDND